MFVGIDLDDQTIELTDPLLTEIERVFAGGFIGMVQRTPKIIESGIVSELDSPLGHMR